MSGTVAAQFKVYDQAPLLIVRALSKAKSPEGVIAAFGGNDKFNGVLAGIARTDGAYGALKPGDLLRAKPGESPFDTASRFESLAMQWEQSRPSLPATAYGWLASLGLTDTGNPEQEKLNNVVLLAAARAEMVRGEPAFNARQQPGEPAYHSRLHFMQVLQIVGHLIEKNEQMLKANDPEAVELTNRHKTLAIIAALVHDLDHPGGTNGKDADGKFILFEIEDESFRRADRLFKAACLSPEDREIIHVALRTTDPNGPSAFLKKAMKAHEQKQGVTLSDLVPKDDEERYKGITRVIWDKQAAFISTVLSVADLAPSAGAGRRLNAVNSVKFTQEMHEAGDPEADFTTPKARNGFFNFVVGADGFANAVGRRAFNPVFGAMMEETERELGAAKPEAPARKLTAA